MLRTPCHIRWQCIRQSNTCAGWSRRLSDQMPRRKLDRPRKERDSMVQYTIDVSSSAANDEPEHLIRVSIDKLCERAQNSSLTTDKVFQLSLRVLRALRSSKLHQSILALNIIWSSYMKPIAHKRPELELEYHLAFLHILANSGQAQLLFEYWDQVASVLNYSEKKLLLEQFPLEKLLQNCLKFNDIGALVKAIYWYTSTGSMGMIPLNLWLRFATIGTDANNYELVKLVYDKFIMHGFETSTLSISDAVVNDFESKNTIFKHLSEETISRILHTLSKHGDVDLTLRLIETHYLLKRMRGERGLTKSLCVNIIDAYSQILARKSYERFESSSSDSTDGVKKLLGVWNSFIIKFANDPVEKLTYVDISDSFSQVLFNHKYTSSLTKSPIAYFNQEGDTKELDTKMSNFGISAMSPLGNCVANLNTLDEFVTNHLEYMLADPTFVKETRVLFLKCIMNHVAIHQNLTGVIAILSSHHHKLGDAIDSEVIDIILFSLSRSSAAKLCAVAMHHHLLRTQHVLLPRRYAWLLTAQVRGDPHAGIQYFIYHFLKSYGTIPKGHVMEFIDELSEKTIRENSGTQRLVEHCQYLRMHDRHMTGPEVDEFYEQHTLTCSSDKIGQEPVTATSRKYYREYDLRDCDALQRILSTTY